MSLQDIYDANFGGEASQETEKTADEKEVEEKFAKFNEEEVAKLGAMASVLDSFGMEFKTGVEKLAAACNLIDHLSEDDGEGAPEKTASDDEAQAAELDAAGRLMARSFMDELESAEKTASAPKGSFAARLSA